MPGEHSFEYALTTYRGGWQEAQIQPMAHSFAHPLLAYATNEHEGSVAEAMPLALFSSPAVVPSAMHRGDADGAPIIRVFNASAASTEAAVRVPAGSHGAGLVDLMERPRGEPSPVNGSWQFPLRPWEIATLRFGRR